MIVGNPPFIRFQRFTGDARARALRSALQVGARLSRLTASWAPFLLHALQFLRTGGAMAMVVPAELAQTAYGVVTLRALCGNFGRVRLVTFRENWFEGVQQETSLLLAEERGRHCPSAELIPLDTIDDPRRLVFALLSSVSLLSMELEGRSYGGGVLKLEPTEMQRVRVIFPTLPEGDFISAFSQADRLLRDGDISAATALVDRTILGGRLGLSKPKILKLSNSREILSQRRMARAGRVK